MTDDTAKRLEDLEVRLAYQDDLVAQLDGLVRELFARVERTELELGQLRELASRDGTEASTLLGEKPPHYGS